MTAYNSAYMFDWDKAFRISRLMLVVCGVILVMAVFVAIEPTQVFFEQIIARSGNNEPAVNFIKGLMKVNPYIGIIDFWFTICALISYVITRIKRSRYGGWP